jgi:hypothetical protein
VNKCMYVYAYVGLGVFVCVESQRKSNLSPTVKKKLRVCVCVYMRLLLQ